MDVVAIRESFQGIFGSWLNTDSSNNLGLAVFLFFIFYGTVCGYWITIARSNKPMPKLRRVAGLDAMDEAIGRATEMGRPVLYNIGMNSFSAPTFASLAVLGYAASRVAHYDTRMITVMRYPEIIPVAESTVRQAYLEAGKPDSFRSEDVRFLTTDQFGFASGVVGIVIRDQVAANMMFGNFLAESLIFAEAGSDAGAIQIAGTTNNVQTPFFIASCDYCLLAEEIYVASAYLSQDRIRIATLIAQDYGKMFLAGLAIVGTIFVSFGSSLISDLLTLY